MYRRRKDKTYDQIQEKGEKTAQHYDYTACPFCNIGQDSRHHWRLECPRTEDIMTQINITRGGILADAGFSLRFDTNLRANIIHRNNLSIHIPPEVLLNNLTTTINHDNTEHHSFDNRIGILQANNNNTNWFLSDRIALMATLWKSPGYTEFTSETYQAIRECILRHKETKTWMDYHIRFTILSRSPILETFVRPGVPTVTKPWITAIGNKLSSIRDRHYRFLCIIHVQTDSSLGCQCCVQDLLHMLVDSLGLV